MFPELISKSDKAQLLHSALHVHGFQECFVKSNHPLLPNFAVKLDLISCHIEIIFLVRVLT